MKTFRLFALLVLASGMSAAASASPLALNAGDSVLLSWDLTGQSPAPPYDRVNVSLGFTHGANPTWQTFAFGNTDGTDLLQTSGLNQGVGNLTAAGLVDGQFSLLFKLLSGSVSADFSAFGSIDNGDGKFTSAARLAPANVAFVPEPATLGLVAVGAIGVAVRRWRTRAA